MNIGNIIQNIATASAVVLGITYIIGGLIVNLNLARRGLVEYQILKVKYLVVGIIFLMQSIGIFVFASLPAFLLSLIDTNNIYVFEVINIISMLAGISLLLAWARLSVSSKSYFKSWGFWFLAASIGYIFPAMQLLRELLFPFHNVIRIVLDGQAILTVVLTFLAQIYHYSAFYYGVPSKLVGTLDPIGTGIPSRIQIACSAENATLLKNLGVPMNRKNVTDELFLIDETDNNYIVAFDLIPNEHNHAGTLKIDKSLVKAILFTAVGRKQDSAPQ
jgi:hypothetical protein